MAAIKLTPARIRDLKYKTDGPRNQRIWDNEVSGLGVEVYATGRKKYLFAYRHDGKQKFLVMGQTTDKTLDEARDEAIGYRRDVSNGIDPKNPPVENVESQGGTMTLAQLFKTYDAELFDTFTKDTASNMRSTYRKYLEPTLGDRPLASIRRADIKEIHDGIKAAGKEGAARGFLVRSKMIFNYGLEESYMETNPADKIKGRYTTSGKREHWLKTDQELWDCWNVDTRPTVRGLVRLLLLTGARRDEIRTLTWENVKDGVLRVTGTKTGTELVLPITPMMESVLSEMHGMHGDKSEFVFPATTSFRKPIPAGSLHHLLNAHADGWHCHTLRHTVKTHLAELKIPLEARAAILNHKLAGVGEGVYNHSEMMEFKRDGMGLWHAKLEKLLRPHLKFASEG